MHRSRCDLHQFSAGCVIGRWFGSKVVCFELLSREVGEYIYAEDSTAIDGALVCIEFIN